MPSPTPLTVSNRRSRRTGCSRLCTSTISPGPTSSSRPNGASNGCCGADRSLDDDGVFRPRHASDRLTAMDFGATTTTADVLAGIDLSGRTALVTGASAGIGEETARSLASAGAHVILACRDADKGQTAMERIRTSVPEASLELGPLDLASLASVRSFASYIGERDRHIDLLINNAGVMACPLGRTAEGFELQLGTNHLGHFLLTNLLTGAVTAGSAPRIVNLTSRGHVRSGIHWDDPQYLTRPYDKWEAYGHSKTANILFTVELERRLAPLGVHAYAVHPGVIATELSRYLTRDDFKDMSSRTPGGRLELKPLEA